MNESSQYPPPQGKPRKEEAKPPFPSAEGGVWILALPAPARGSDHPMVPFLSLRLAIMKAWNCLWDKSKTGVSQKNGRITLGSVRTGPPWRRLLGMHFH